MAKISNADGSSSSRRVSKFEVRALAALLAACLSRYILGLDPYMSTFEFCFPESGNFSSSFICCFYGEVKNPPPDDASINRTSRSIPRSMTVPGNSSKSPLDIAADCDVYWSSGRPGCSSSILYKALSSLFLRFPLRFLAGATKLIFLAIY